MTVNASGGFAVIAEFKVKPGCVEQFVALALDDARSSTKDESGCRTFDVVLDHNDPETVLFYEVYDDRAAFDHHLRTEHLARFRAGFPNLIVAERPVRFFGLL